MAKPPYSVDDTMSTPSSGTTSTAAAAAAAAARDRQKKSTMACEMCRKRKVKCIFDDSSASTCTFCAKYSFQCVVNTARKRRGPRPRKQLKDVKSPLLSSPPVMEEEQRVSMSTPYSDHENEEFPDSPPMTNFWEKEKEESAFILFLEQLNSFEFDLPIGVNESPEVVRHCLTLFFTHINTQQCEFLNGPMFLQDLKANQVQPCLINALCAVSARFSNHPSLVTQPRYLSGASFAKTAREQCHLDRPIFRLWIIQTLVLLALYSFSINEGAQAWFELGAANRIAQIISLKVDPDAARPPGIPPVSHRELQAFLQIAKSLYVMERLMISGTPSRPAMIADMDFFYDPVENTQDEDYKSPSEKAIDSPVDDPWRMSDESPHIIKLLHVWEHISLFEREGFVELDPPPWNSHSRFQELRLMLDDWMLRLPKDLQFSSETLALRISEGKGAQLVFLHCLYHHCSIVLNRVFLPILPWKQEFPGAPIFFLRERQNKCINSAASISIIIEEAVRSKTFILPPFMGYCVFQSSIVHIHQSFCTQGETAAEVKRDLKTNLQVLLVVKEFYKPAETWCTVIREMYEVHSEWETRVCPVGVQSLSRQFRRYFDRFEGRIKEPPYAVYDDLAYTQGSPPAAKQERSDASPPEKVVGGMVTGPNLEEYRERLRGFAMDLKEDDMMRGVVVSGEPAPTDLANLYNFPILLEEHGSPSVTRDYSEPMENNMFSNPFTGISEAGSFQGIGQGNMLSPFDVGSIPTQGSAAAAPTQTEEDLPDYLFGLDGVIDQGFLQFLDSAQQ